MKFKNYYDALNESNFDVYDTLNPLDSTYYINTDEIKSNVGLLDAQQNKFEWEESRKVYKKKYAKDNYCDAYDNTTKCSNKAVNVNDHCDKFVCSDHLVTVDLLKIDETKIDMNISKCEAVTGKGNQCTKSYKAEINGKKLCTTHLKKESEDNNYYKTIKTSLISFIKDDRFVTVILDAVKRNNRIITHTYQLLNLLVRDPKQRLPKIDTNFLKAIMRSVSIKTTNVGNKTNDDDIMDYYQEHFAALVPESDVAENTGFGSQNFQLEANDMLKNIENHIKANYGNFLRRFINTVFNKKQIISEIKDDKTLDADEKKAQVAKFNRELSKVKDDIAFVRSRKQYKSLEKYHELINDVKRYVKPDKTSYQQDDSGNENLYLDVHFDCQNYLSCMVYMNALIEKHGGKTFAILPMRYQMAPKHMQFDTSNLINIFYTGSNNNKAAMLKLPTAYKHEIWNKIFKVEKFKRNKHKFNHHIRTDGISCSLTFVSNKVKARLEKQKERYVTDLTPEECKKLKKKRKVGVDPNKRDRIYCSDGRITFRHTTNQKNVESRNRHYKKLLQVDKAENGIGDIEARLSTNVNSKSSDFKKFKKYLADKNIANHDMYDYYEKPMHRKFKLNRYSNTQRCEAKMINNFSKKFGSSDECVILFGDFDQQRLTKYHEPTKGLGLRRAFRKRGYQVLLVDEYLTSKICYNCDKRSLEAFHKRKNPRPYKDNTVTVHGLLRCQTVKCKTVWNRDKVASLNIQWIGSEWIERQTRPKCLRRGKQSESSG